MGFAFEFNAAKATNNLKRTMKNSTAAVDIDSVELDPLRERPDLDLSKGVRGKYYDRMKGRASQVPGPYRQARLGSIDLMRELKQTTVKGYELQ